MSNWESEFITTVNEFLNKEIEDINRNHDTRKVSFLKKEKYAYTDISCIENLKILDKIKIPKDKKEILYESVYASLSLWAKYCSLLHLKQQEDSTAYKKLFILENDNSGGIGRLFYYRISNIEKDNLDNEIKKMSDKYRRDCASIRNYKRMIYFLLKEYIEGNKDIRFDFSRYAYNLYQLTDNFRKNIKDIKKDILLAIKKESSYSKTKESSQGNCVEQENLV